MKKIFKQHMILEKTLSSDHWLETMVKMVALGVLLGFANPNFAAGNKITKLVCTNDQIAKWDGTGWICAEDIDTDTNTNAQTQCSSSDQLLDSDGDCIAIPVDTDSNTNAETICSSGQVLMGDGSCKTLAEDLPELPTATSGAYQLVYCADTDSLEWSTGPYSIGDTSHAGGIVFHTTDCGLHGLEAAPVDHSTFVVWCLLPSDIAGVDNILDSATPDSHSGAHNTPLIEAVCGPNSAAEIAANHVWPNGQSDGFLPNKEELDLMYNNIGEGASAPNTNVGGFATGGYWSSSEGNGISLVWGQNFSGGNQAITTKNVTRRVRAVRAF